MNCTVAAVLKGPLETYSAAMPKRPTPAVWASIFVQVGTMLEASMELVVDIVYLTGKKDSGGVVMPILFGCGECQLSVKKTRRGDPINRVSVH
jgi:hypothetical protein